MGYDTRHTFCLTHAETAVPEAADSPCPPDPEPWLPQGHPASRWWEWRGHWLSYEPHLAHYHLILPPFPGCWKFLSSSPSLPSRGAQHISAPGLELGATHGTKEGSRLTLSLERPVCRSVQEQTPTYLFGPGLFFQEFPQDPG